MMFEYIGSQAFAEREARHQGGRFPQPGYLFSAMAMFDRFEHEIAALQWLEYRLPPFAIADLLVAFPNTCLGRCHERETRSARLRKSLAHAAISFEGNEAQVIACEHLESFVNLEIMEEFWERFLLLIIDRNTLVLFKT